MGNSSHFLPGRVDPDLGVSEQVSLSDWTRVKCLLF